MLYFSASSLVYAVILPQNEANLWESEVLIIQHLRILDFIDFKSENDGNYVDSNIDQDYKEKS